MKAIRECLNSQISKICLLSFFLEKVQEMVREQLPSPLSDHVKVGSLQKGQLLLLVDDPVWATELNFMLPALRNDLRGKHQLYQLCGIKIKVVMEPFQAPQSFRHANSMSQSLREKIFEDAQHVEDADIRQALEKLSGLSKL